MADMDFDLGTLDDLDLSSSDESSDEETSLDNLDLNDIFGDDDESEEVTEDSEESQADEDDFEGFEDFGTDDANDKQDVSSDSQEVNKETPDNSTDDNFVSFDDFDDFQDQLDNDDNNENNQKDDVADKSDEPQGDTDLEFDTLDSDSIPEIGDVSSLTDEEIESKLKELGIYSSEYETLSPSDSNDVNEEKQDEAEDNDINIDISKKKHMDNSIDADHDGSILNSDSLLSELETVNKEADFISDTGEIVVMDNSETGDNFKFQYIDIENIAIVKRIRKNTANVDDLVQSIKSTGLLEPLVVAPTATEGVYVLLAGFRRIMACAKAGKRRIPCIVNLKANIPEIPVLEALYNHSRSYTIREIVDYIDYLEKQKGIMSASMIEYLLQLNSGDYTKLKDILNDNDDDIVSKLFDGIYNIETAFKKLEQRRKKESAEEKENKKAARVYEDEEESGAADIAGSGEEADNEEFSDDEYNKLAFNASQLSDADDEDFEDLVEEGKNIEGFKPHKQDPKERERLDPTLRKAVLARDNNTCQICKIASGQEFVETLDVHHIQEVYLGGDDSIDNLITACTVCHKLVHLYGRGELNIRPLDQLSEQEQSRFKRVMKLGNYIRQGLAAKNMKKEDLKKVDHAETIGRTKPGTERQIAT